MFSQFYKAIEKTKKSLEIEIKKKEFVWLIMGGEPLSNIYLFLSILTNNFIKNHKKNLRNRKKNHKYILKFMDWMCFKYSAIWVHLIFHQSSSKLCDNFNGLNSMVSVGISNNTQIASNLKHNQSHKFKIFIIFFLFWRFYMSLYDVSCQICQKKIVVYPHPFIIIYFHYTPARITKARAFHLVQADLQHLHGITTKSQFTYELFSIPPLCIVQNLHHNSFPLLTYSS
jgi:hypothetical protein